MTLALCSLYFVVTGIQLWITEYLTLYIGISKVCLVLVRSSLELGHVCPPA